MAAAARTASRTLGRRTAPASLISRAVVLASLLGCVPAVGPDRAGSQSNYPPASVYDIDPQFAGEWVGYVDGLPGTLKLGELDERTFFGSFVTEDGSTEYTLLLEHTYVDTEDGGEVPSNRTTFTWQDGLGSRGKGWLLISREDTHLTGSFGYGLATSGLGDWSFERQDDAESSSSSSRASRTAPQRW